MKIGQALRLSLEQGMHTNMEDQGLDDAHVQRCMNVWWTVYILDRQMSSLMGLPLALQDNDISAPLPTISGSVQKSLALEIHVKLSRILSQILNSESKHGTRHKCGKGDWSTGMRTSSVCSQVSQPRVWRDRVVADVEQPCTETMDALPGGLYRARRVL